MRNKLRNAGLILYGLVSIYTFGHAANARSLGTNEDFHFVWFGAVLWPFYWSYEWQRPKPLQ